MGGRRGGKIQVEVAAETFELLQRYGRPLVDTADDVIKRILHYLVREGIDIDDLSLSSQRLLPVNMPTGRLDRGFVDIDLGGSGSRAIRYRLIPLKADVRSIFPGYKVSFQMETDLGIITTHVTSAPQGTPVGDPLAGSYICKGLGYWFETHKDELKAHPMVRVQVIEPFVRYRMELLS